MSRIIDILVLACALLAFIAIDHTRSPAPDHAELEVWRVSGAAGACAPCGALCEADDDE